MVFSACPSSLCHHGLHAPSSLHGRGTCCHTWHITIMHMCACTCLYVSDPSTCNRQQINLLALCSTAHMHDLMLWLVEYMQMHLGLCTSCLFRVQAITNVPHVIGSFCRLGTLWP
jgi:hypothetical protein